ncbi:helix-turn-helix domain-containing protein [Marimonas sp. MJW-29]|uniref:Helix-turn-helix domain-containing protein n=1 Tax=Sulfitobacter sediminis TaxID=3234186 RepID=A0ABV3RP32_9RHOB
MQTPPQDIQIRNLARFSQGQDWRVRLLHDRPHHLLLWITRGQGRIILDGLRRGTGAHNAIFVPAGHPFALDLGRQSTGLAVVLPQEVPLHLPQIPRHLRIRDVQTQTELTGLIEAAAREDTAKRPLVNDALEAHAALISVWLRRQILSDEHIPEKRNAAARLSKRFCDMLPTRYRSGDTMADYAADLGVTPTHLTRAVKSATGKTAADLLTERVLHEARRLLADTSEPAQRIAAYLGIGSAAYFTRFIQHHTGATPSKSRGT